MSVIKTVQAGNPIIHAKSEDVADVSSPETKRIVTDLIDSMRDVGLVGMAAPQIGENVRIFVSEVRETDYRKEGTDSLRVFINPKVVSTSERTNTDYEGCGSVATAEFFGPVERATEITVEAVNENGETFTHTTSGLPARVIQHELDHLDGVLFPEKVSDMKKIMSREEYLKMRRK